MSIYVTGDTHCDFKRFTRKQLNKLSIAFSNEDYIIICGDFGLLWADDKEFKYNLDWLSRLPFKILWIQGNHENYNMIKEYKLEYWNGGSVRHIVRDRIILLERGQVFNIQGKTFFTFGGAQSHDIEGGILNRNSADFKEKKNYCRKHNISYRILNETWWEDELPTIDELELGIYNLLKVGNKVDYIITHCASSYIQKGLELNTHRLENNILTEYFDKLEIEIDFKHWYFGHYHKDQNIDSKHTILYNNIIKIGE